ncbi:twitching motility protein PilT [Clostridiales bacterium PH28_bin88]|nr:twitching motility protein PilT [Clostridiales bacterium PH28_bin88]
MIAYLDTSALVKLYVSEEGSEVVHRAVTQATVAATSQIAYAEARAAFSRSWREGLLSEGDYRRTIALFRADWDRYLALAVSDKIIFLAGDLTEYHQLRGLDAIHLASLITLRQQTEEPMTALCWDTRLKSAMRDCGFSVC